MRAIPIVELLESLVQPLYSAGLVENSNLETRRGSGAGETLSSTCGSSIGSILQLFTSIYNTCQQNLLVSRNSKPLGWNAPTRSILRPIVRLEWQPVRCTSYSNDEP